MKIFNIGQFITRRLQDITTNLYPVVAPVNTVFPFVVYRRTGGQAINRDKDVEEESVVVEIKVVDTSYANSISLINSITDALIGYCDYNITRIMLLSTSEEFYDESFIQNIVIQIDLE